MSPLSKADTDHGWLKLAHELAEALARADLTGTEYAVCFWVMCRTYGVRRMIGRNYAALKFAPFTQRQVAMDLGRERKAVAKGLEELLAKSILITNDRGLIGFNTAVGGWRRDVIRGRTMGLWRKQEELVDSLGKTSPTLGLQPHPPGATAPGSLGLQPHPPGATAPGSSYARAGESLESRRVKTESALGSSANGARPLNFCAYKDRGQGQCRDAAEPSSKFCAPHGLKVQEKFIHPRAEGKPKGLVSAAEAVKEMGFGQGREDGRG